MSSEAVEFTPAPKFARVGICYHLGMPQSPFFSHWHLGSRSKRGPEEYDTYNVMTEMDIIVWSGSISKYFVDFILLQNCFKDVKLPTP